MASRTLYCCLLAVVLAIAPPSFAKTKKAKGAPQPRFLNGSAESSKERDHRLLRECKGRPNAGACAGYTH
jgi:hypothetical protein